MVRAFRGMRTFDKYKTNLREHNGEIWSYSTKVAEIKDDGKLHQLGCGQSPRRNTLTMQPKSLV